MKSPTVYSRWALSLCIACLWPFLAYGQVQTNTAEIATILENAASLSTEIAKQTATETAITAETAVMHQQFSAMKKWQEKYNNYLNTAAGYADAIRAGSTLISEGVRTFIALKDVYKAISYNPEGIVSTALMNNLYVEVAVELIRTVRLYNFAIAKGGDKNMINGAERTELLWTINDAMTQLNRKLHSLALSISYFNMVDVWNDLTAGMLDKSHGQIAREAYKRWHRASQLKIKMKLDS